MKKLLILLIIVLVSIFTVACSKNDTVTYTFDKDYIELYNAELTQVFGEYRILSKERITSIPTKSYNKTITKVYDEWEIEFINSHQDARTYRINNVNDIVSQIKLIILDNLEQDIFKNVQWKFKEPFIQFENGFDQVETIDEIPKEFFPINLVFSNLPKALLTVIIINPKDLQDYRYNIDSLTQDMNTLTLRNVLILYEDEAYYMSHGLFYHDQKLVSSSIKVEDTLKWINDNQ